MPEKKRLSPAVDVPPSNPSAGKTSSLEKPDFSGIAAELKRARTRAGIKHSELHRLTGVSRTVLIGYESGRTKPGAREIRLICDALKITPNRLLYGKEDPFSKKEHPWADVIESDDKAAIRLTMLYKMLAHDERAAIVTIIHSLLEARHGKAKIEEVTEVFRALEEWTPELMEDMGDAIEKVVTPEKLAKIEADAKRRFAKFEKPEGKRRKGK